MCTCSTGSTFATDMFAFGQTMACVEDACNPKDITEAVPAASIISSLTIKDYKLRMTASKALEHSFFDATKEVLKAEMAECAMCIGDACPVGRVKASEGVICSVSQHFVCASCLEALVAKSLQPGGDNNTANLSRLSDGKIHCPHCLAQQPCLLCDYTDSQLAKVISASLLDAYLRTRMQLLEDRKMCELEAEMQQKLKQVHRPSL